MSVSIVIPAYKEAESLAVLLPQVQKVMPNAQILVIWDGPDDGTVKLCYDLGITVLGGKGKGLGAAILLGIAAAAYDHVIIMDGDGQHPAKILPAFARSGFIVGWNNDANGHQFLPMGVYSPPRYRLLD